MAKMTMVLGLGAVAMLAVSALAAQAARELVIDGRVVSPDVKQEDGHYWVSLDDVGRYFGYFVSVNQSQVNLTKIPTAPVPGTVITPPTGATPATLQGSANPAATEMAVQTGAAQQFATGTGTDVNRADWDTRARPNQITVSLGQTASIDGVDYKVTDIREAGATYKNTFDQRAGTLRAKYKTDTLVVVDIEETSHRAMPMPAFIPGADGITVFDGQKVGYAATGLDVRQAADLVQKSTSSSDDVEGMDASYAGASGLMLGSGGTLRFAAIASVPGHDPITSVVINVTNSGIAENQTGTMVTVNR